MSNQRFILSKHEILEQYDMKLSWRPQKALAMMNEESWFGDGDVGRLMQIQTFKGGPLFDSGTSVDREYFDTWRLHYIGLNVPFLSVRVVSEKGKLWVIIFKRREAIEDQAKKKWYQTHPEVKENQRIKNQEAKKKTKIRDRRGKLVASIESSAYLLENT